MVITALDHVPHCYNTTDGEIIAALLRREIGAERAVTLSLAGVGDVPSSFVNAAFVSLLDEFAYETIKQRLSVIDSNPQINDMIRRCFQNAVRRMEPA